MLTAVSSTLPPQTVAEAQAWWERDGFVGNGRIVE